VKENHDKKSADTGELVDTLEHAEGAEESAEPAAPEDIIADLKEQVATLEDRFLRQAADFQNFRRRAIDERTTTITFAKARVVEEFLDVWDDLRRSVEAAENTDADPTDAFESLKSGVRMVYDKLAGQMEKLNVTPIDSVGQTFNEEEHEAIMQAPAPSSDKVGTVLAEVQKGYRIGDRVIRHARVVVGSEPLPAAAPASDNGDSGQSSDPEPSN
jgi:molecular chaperone GrpE